MPLHGATKARPLTLRICLLRWNIPITNAPPEDTPSLSLSIYLSSYQSRSLFLSLFLNTTRTTTSFSLPPSHSKPQLTLGCDDQKRRSIHYAGIIALLFEHSQGRYSQCSTSDSGSHLYFGWVEILKDDSPHHFRWTNVTLKASPNWLSSHYIAGTILMQTINLNSNISIWV